MLPTCNALGLELWGRASRPPLPRERRLPCRRRRRRACVSGRELGVQDRMCDPGETKRHPGFVESCLSEVLPGMRYLLFVRVAK